MRSSTSSSERPTAADRPGVAQPVPVREIPRQPWQRIYAVVLLLTLLLAGVWEWRMRTLELLPGDLGDGPSAWAEQRRRIDSEHIPVAIVGDSRILFDTDLDRFRTMTGVQPLQLALAGTNARPFLEDLSDDPHFNGLAIVGISEFSYFREGVGLMKDALTRYHHESPAQRISFILHRALSRVLGFLDDNYRLSNLIERLDPDWRPGVRGPYHDVWKISAVSDDRQYTLWSRIEHDAFLRDHARAVWLNAKRQPVTDAIVKMTLERTRVAVAKIRARGGDVIFVRPPSAPQLRVLEDKLIPRRRGWDALLAAAHVTGIHFDDVPAMQGLVIPEFSHLNRSCSEVFTDAFVRRLAQLTPRVSLRTNVPPLSPRDCVAQRPVPGSVIATKR